MGVPIEFSIDLFNIDSKMGSNGVPRGVGGPLLMMIGDAMTPFDPVLLSMLNKSMLNSMLLSFFFDVTRLQIFDGKLVSMLQFLIFPYSMLTPSIIILIAFLFSKIR